MSVQLWPLPLICWWLLVVSVTQHSYSHRLIVNFEGTTPPAYKQSQKFDTQLIQSFIDILTMFTDNFRSDILLTNPFLMSLFMFMFWFIFLRYKVIHMSRIVTAWHVAWSAWHYVTTWWHFTSHVTWVVPTVLKKREQSYGDNLTKITNDKTCKTAMFKFANIASGREGVWGMS